MLRGHSAVMLIVPSDMRPLESYDSASVPKPQMQNRDLAEPNQRLRSCTRGIEVKAVDDTVRTLYRPRWRANARTTKGFVDVGEAVFVSTGQVVPHMSNTRESISTLRPQVARISAPSRTASPVSVLAGDTNLTRSPAFSSPETTGESEAHAPAAAPLHLNGRGANRAQRRDGAPGQRSPRPSPHASARLTAIGPRRL
jgi:hypothetical protein